MSDTAKRREQGIDFIDYFLVGTSIVVQKGNPNGIKTADDFCGKTIGIQKGTTQEDVAKAQADKCVKDGKGKLMLRDFKGVPLLRRDLLPGQSEQVPFQLDEVTPEQLTTWDSAFIHDQVGRQ